MVVTGIHSAEPGVLRWLRSVAFPVTRWRSHSRVRSRFGATVSESQYRIVAKAVVLAESTQIVKALVR